MNDEAMIELQDQLYVSSCERRRLDRENTALRLELDWLGGILGKTRSALWGTIDELEHATFDHECSDDDCERCEVIAIAKSVLTAAGGKGVEDALE